MSAYMLNAGFVMCGMLPQKIEQNILEERKGATIGICLTIAMAHTQQLKLLQDI